MEIRVTPRLTPVATFTDPGTVASVTREAFLLQEYGTATGNRPYEAPTYLTHNFGFLLSLHA